jgi:hypothetical protein
MAGISALGTTYNLPNYTGELFQLSPSTAPFLTMAGGLSGGMQTSAPKFEWETEDLRTSTPNNVVLEGQDATGPVGRVRANVYNVLEIHQSFIEVSYTKQAAVQYRSGLNTGQEQPITDELAHQINAEVIAKKRDVNASFLVGTFQEPTDNTTKRQTRGIITAVTTNLQDAAAGVTQTFTTATNGTFTAGATHGLSVGDTVIPLTVVTNTEVAVDTPYYVLTVPSSTTFTLASAKGGSTITFASTGSGTYSKGVAITDTLVGGLLQGIYDNGGLTEDGTFTLFCGSASKIGLSKAYIKSYGAGYFPQSRTVGGVKVDTILTDFGTCNIVVDRQMPKHKILAATMSEVHPVFMDVPGRGHFFVEPLAKTGAQEKVQLYGEIGLAYGAERHHGVLKNLVAF